MLLPNYEQAVIPDSKLRDYCLNMDHKTGKHKAILFNSVLGIKQENYLNLKELILKQLENFPAKLKFKDRFGERYFVDISLEGIYSHILRTAWIIKDGKDKPILITCYLKQIS